MNGMGRLSRVKKEDQPAFGVFIMIPSPTVVEIFAALRPRGVDFLGIEAQHQAFNPETLAQTLRTADLLGLPCLVHVGPRDLPLAELVLDLGAAGVIFPVVNTASEAREAVSVCRYPPAGRRSMGGLRNLLGRGDLVEDHEPLCIIQIERAEAVKSLEEILSVDGIDAILPGPLDLAISMGLDASKASYASYQEVVAEVQTVMIEIERGAAAHAIAKMRHCETGEAAMGAIREGCDLITLSSDAALLLRSAGGLMEELLAARDQLPR